MRITLISLILLLSATLAQASDIEGSIIVMDRSGQSPLKSNAYAVVYLEGFSTEPTGTAMMDQQGKRFIPRLLAVVSGQPIRFSNSDIYQHSVFSPHAEEPFDLSRYRRGESRIVVLREIGPHTIYCNIHQDMIADVFVVPNRYFSLTDDAGNFRITDVPEGDHRLRVWHILGGSAARSVTVGNESLSIALRLRSRKMVVEKPEAPQISPQDTPYAYDKESDY